MGAGSDRRIQLEVNLSGRFNARLDQVPLFKNAERSRQVISLFVFLLLHRFENISQERLIEAMWPDDESDDPVNALKNLVYRLRKVISSHGKFEAIPEEEPEEELPEEIVPAASPEEDVVEEQDVPYNAPILPQTGGIPLGLMISAGTGLMTAGFSLRKKKKDDAE